MENMKRLVNNSNTLYSNITRLKTSLKDHYHKNELSENNIAIDISINRIIEELKKVEDLLQYLDTDYLDFLDEENNRLEIYNKNSNYSKLIHLRLYLIREFINSSWTGLGFKKINHLVFTNNHIDIILDTSISLNNSNKVDKDRFHIYTDNMASYLIFNNQNKESINRFLLTIFNDYNIVYNIKTIDNTDIIYSIELKSDIDNISLENIDNHRINRFKDNNIGYKINDIETHAKYIRDLLHLKEAYMGYELDINMAYLVIKLNILFKDLKSNYHLILNDKKYLDKLDKNTELENSLRTASINNKNIEKKYLNNIIDWWTDLGFIDDIKYISKEKDIILLNLPCTRTDNTNYEFSTIEIDTKTYKLEFSKENKDGIIQIINERYPLIYIKDILIDLDINNIAIINNIIIELRFSNA